MYTAMTHNSQQGLHVEQCILFGVNNQKKIMKSMLFFKTMANG